MDDGFISNMSVWQMTTFQMAFGIAVEHAQQQRHTTSVVSAKHTQRCTNSRMLQPIVQGQVGPCNVRWTGTRPKEG